MLRAHGLLSQTANDRDLTRIVMEFDSCGLISIRAWRIALNARPILLQPGATS